jgi:RNA polymerase sigma-70 factor (ECF subfamily)
MSTKLEETIEALAPPAALVDADLVHRNLEGDAEAARTLHARYHSIAASFLRKLGVQAGDIDDACQEVFLQFFRYLPSFRGEAELKTWLYRLCITEARRARRRGRIGATLRALLAREQAGHDRVPPATLSEETMAHLCQDALDRMSAGHRLVFVLYEMEGVPGKQIAEIAGCPVATVWRRLHDARHVFRKALGLEPPPEEAPRVARADAHSSALS